MGLRYACSDQSTIRCSARNRVIADGSQAGAQRRAHGRVYDACIGTTFWPAGSVVSSSAARASASEWSPMYRL